MRPATATLPQPAPTIRSCSTRLASCIVKECKAATESVKPENTPGKGHEKQTLRDCVKQKVRDLTADHGDAIENAAKQCQTERTTDPVAFRNKYGTNENKSNAFGKCVSTTVRHTEESQPQGEIRPPWPNQEERARSAFSTFRLQRPR